ncbi:MAG: hypothetical protein DWQ42_00250 [Planctomycetota bacterium]|nr:MAG: hypothetical protein DWQ42_00250 [Planctomycetota bacterium]REK43106.1 MAG: hypothetical protein DWQ46_12080 [Planctomycetota bacterium]
MVERLAMSIAPFWLVGMGALFALAILLGGWLLVRLVSRDAAAELLDLAGRPALRVVLIVATFFATMSLLATAAAPFDFELLGFRLFEERGAALASVARIPFVGEKSYSFEIQGNAVEHPIELYVRRGELQRLLLVSDRDLRLTLNARESEREEELAVMKVSGTDRAEWKRHAGSDSPLMGELRVIYVSNNSDEPATLTLTTNTEVAVPEARAIPMTTFGLLAYVLSFLILRFGFRKTSAIAMAGCKESVSQPLFYIILAIGASLMVVLLYLPYFTFGEDVKQFKDSGLTLIVVLSLGFIFWTSSTSLAAEIEGRTALSVLSKPVGRPSFVIGKFLGMASSAAIIFVLLGSLLLVFTSYKAMYEAGEVGRRSLVTWQECYQEMAQLAPGLLLGFMETVVLASIVVALSTRLAMVPNLIVCVSIYVVGHLLPLLVQSTIGDLALVHYMSRLMATLLPVLEYFNYYGAIASGQTMPLSLVALTGLYALIYVTIAMLLGLAMFEDRDLA